MGFFSYGRPGVLTFYFFSYFSCNVLFEVDSILLFKWFASHYPFSLLLYRVVSMKKRTICLIFFVMKNIVWCCCCCEDSHEPNLWLAHLFSWGRAMENNSFMKGIVMLVNNDDMDNATYVGGLCFLQSHFRYFPPCFYRQIHG